MTTSALRPFSRQYSCACSTCRTSGRSSSLDDAHEQDRQVAGDAVRPQAGLAELVRRERRPARARSEPSAKSTRDASRSNSSASSLEMPRWRRRALRVREGEREACAPRRSGRGTSGASACGGLAIGRDAGGETRGAPTPPGAQPDALAQAEDRDRARRRSCPTAAGRRARAGRRRRGRGRGTARGRSPTRPAPAAGLRGSARAPPTRRARADRAAADGRAAPRCPAGTRSRRTACRRPDARGRRRGGASTISA